MLQLDHMSDAGENSEAARFVRSELYRVVFEEGSLRSAAALRRGIDSYYSKHPETQLHEAAACVIMSPTRFKTRL